MPRPAAVSLLDQQIAVMADSLKSLEEMGFPRARAYVVSTCVHALRADPGAALLSPAVRGLWL